jgi:hypothetical protein
VVYVVIANKQHSYKLGKSRIVYIGKTKKGAKRVATSASERATAILTSHGMKQLQIYLVTTKNVLGVNVINKLERALLMVFREKYGTIPIGNKAGTRMTWLDEKTYFTRAMLEKIVAKYS